MINAQEARRRSEQNSNSKAKIYRLLELTNKLILQKCEEGFCNVSIDRMYTQKLTNEELEEYITTLKDLGYNVHPVLKSTRTIDWTEIHQLSYYEITW